jgi:hypothetical protein
MTVLATESAARMAMSIKNMKNAENQILALGKGLIFKGLVTGFVSMVNGVYGELINSKNEFAPAFTLY